MTMNDKKYDLTSYDIISSPKTCIAVSALPPADTIPVQPMMDDTFKCVNQPNMPLGWVIATSTQHMMIWECISIATGWYVNSFRLEGISQLVLFVFLETVIDYYQLHYPPLPWSSPDSVPWLCIITRIKSGLAAQTVWFDGAALSSKYDVVNERILEINQCLTLPLICEHVKGHQDARRKWYELTWMETLNVRVD